MQREPLVSVVAGRGLSPRFPIHGFLRNLLVVRLVGFLLFEGIARFLRPIGKTLLAHGRSVPLLLLINHLSREQQQ
jgi:hypothetical protein